MSRRRSLDDYVNLVDATLRRYQPIFADSVHPKKYNKEQPTLHPVKAKSDTGYKIQSYNWPRYLARDIVGGFRLKDNMGFVSIHMEFAFQNEHDVVNEVYSYKFFSRDHQYVYCYNNNDSVQLDYFTFRYDKDIKKNPNDNNEPNEHIQILGHSMPRIITKDISLDDFLQVVQDTCFEELDGSWTGRSVSFHSNRTASLKRAERLSC